jgi:organic hydroperoxide reductase OsmC/OhrA
MHRYEATIVWQRGDQTFTDNRYRRTHEWRFDGGARVPASASPQSVPLPMSDPAVVDPDEALVAATASCHMLFFLSHAAKNGFIVDSYVDEADGVLQENDAGRMAITRITLRPQVVFSGERQPRADDIAAMHHDAHAQCYVANSLRSEIVIEPR